ncbi:sialidase family protein [Luteipulveratus mongoliensis]|uniref:sialidase family protein n=1 Tax=Luteipulveratus mongoliensis TaxID=571913 RepID=UPI000695ED85|nr:sialidase family protein [Luteipulveratus mongoliensis]
MTRLRRVVPLLTVTLAMLLALIASPADAQAPVPQADNVVADPGLEAQPGGALVAPWSCVGTCGADLGDSPHGGQKNAFTQSASGWNAIYQTVSVTPDTTYELTGWIRTSDNLTEGYFGARVPGGGAVRNENRLHAIGPWTQVTVVVSSGRSDKLDVYAGAWANGDTWLKLDDVSLVVIGSNQVGSGTAMYPRAVRLEHSGDANGQILATAYANDNGNYGAIFRSTDEGRTFNKVSEVRDPLASGGQCCQSIYELPTAVGDLPAGALLFSATYNQQVRPLAINLWASTDHGLTWTKRSQVVAGPGANNKGLWEPEMRVNAEGQLTIYYSDETQSAHSQAIMEVFSPDGGKTWSQPYPVVSLGDWDDRPGMPVVRELKNGQRIMTYEICGPNHGCDVFYRTSADGADWGDPGQAGTRIVATDGTRFQHAPTVTVVDDGSATGKLVLAGQLLVNSGGGIDGGNGITLLTNTSGGSGAWTRIWAPVEVPEAYDNPCPNYSSALVPTADQAHVLEISTMWAGPTCIARSATGRV